MDGLAIVEPGPAVIGHVERLVRRSGTSFYWAMRLLPPEKRRAMYAVYAFCREVDDIADEPGHAEHKRLRLQEWREEIDRLYAGRPSQPVARALAPAIARFDLKREDFLAVIDGMEMDAADRVRIADFAGLATYCDRVACAVGRLSNCIFGLDPETGRRLAHALGEALQLTNILRDIDEDGARDRLYLPAELLRRHGISSDRSEAVLADSALAAACREIADMTAKRFEEATNILEGCDRVAVRPARMMMQVYLRTFRRLAARGWDAPRAPVALGTVDKLWIVARYGLV